MLILPKNWRLGKSIIICIDRTLHIKVLHPMKYLKQNLKIGLLSVSRKSDLEQIGNN